MTASDLRIGDVLVTRIGRAPIKSIEPKADGFEIVVDARAPTSTRAEAQGTVPFYYPRQTVTIARNASRDRVRRPLRGFLAKNEQPEVGTAERPISERIGGRR